MNEEPYPQFSNEMIEVVTYIPAIRPTGERGMIEIRTRYSGAMLNQMASDQNAQVFFADTVFASYFVALKREGGSPA